MLNHTNPLISPGRLSSVFSANIVMQSDRKRPDGTSPLYLQLLHNRVKKKVSLKMWWPEDFFDKKAQCFLPRYQGDPDVSDQNIILGTIKARANEIVRTHRISNRNLTIDLFLNDFLNFSSKDCFLFYAKNKCEALYLKGINSHRSKLRHGTGLNALSDFMQGGPLLMKDLNLELIRQFDAWLRKTKRYKHNTISSTHKVIKTYINHALRDNYIIDYPYSGFSTSFRDGDRDALCREELNTLKALLTDPLLTDVEKECLRKFLFSCYTGLRISDSALIHSNQILGGTITHRMKKGERYGKEISIPLPDFAKELIKGRKGLIFQPLADPTVNKALKVIAARAGLEKRLTFHVSRDTFGTLFIELGGDIATLKELMGHSDVKTTMIYVKMSEKRKEKLMANFNNL